MQGAKEQTIINIDPENLKRFFENQKCICWNKIMKSYSETKLPR